MKPEPRPRVAKSAQADPALLPALASPDSNASQRVKAALIHKARTAGIATNGLFAVERVAG